MTTFVEAIAEVSSGVAHLVLERGSEQVGSGSGFLIAGGLVTASHVLRRVDFDTLAIGFDGSTDFIRLARDDVMALTRWESREADHDVVVVGLDEPEFEHRYRFELGSATEVEVGQSVIIMGYPYGSEVLTSHIGHVSARYTRGPVDIVRLDASVNPSNSGGPVVEPDSLRAVAYVTRAETGLTRDFEQVITALEGNAKAVRGGTGGIRVGGIDPLEALEKSFLGMRALAENMKRSANVGIGYAFSSEHLVKNL